MSQEYQVNFSSKDWQKHKEHVVEKIKLHPLFFREYNFDASPLGFPEIHRHIYEFRSKGDVDIKKPPLFDLSFESDGIHITLYGSVYLESDLREWLADVGEYSVKDITLEEEWFNSSQGNNTNL